MPLEVVHADAAFVVLNKPSGLLAVPGKTSNDCLSLLAQAQFADALIVHRLDMATSGLLVMARGLPAQRVLNAAFANREVHKRYVAIVHGDCRPTQSARESATRSAEAPADDGWHTIDLPILVDWPNRPLRKIEPKGGKPSTTRWRCMAYDATHATSRLELEPLTGRSHQLRVHLQAIGHPILGDPLYAPPAIAAQAERLLLHASELGFAHPVTGAWASFVLPDGFGAYP
jgi:tRNA pseudouridine32 synthase/23S rRNA pseudouridine746 synthase